MAGEGVTGENPVAEGTGLTLAAKETPQNK